MSNQGGTGGAHPVALASGPHEDRRIPGTREGKTVGWVGVSGRLRGWGGGSAPHQPRCLSTSRPGGPRAGDTEGGESRGALSEPVGQVLRRGRHGSLWALPHTPTVARVRVKRICSGRAGDGRWGSEA